MQTLIAHLRMSIGIKTTTMTNKIGFLSVLLLFALSDLAAQTVTFEEYDPPSTLKVPENPVSRARFPFIDIHSHQWRKPV